MVAKYREIRFYAFSKLETDLAFLLEKMMIKLMEKIISLKGKKKGF